MFEAENLGDAQRIAMQICREHRLDFVGVFAGHMAALKTYRAALDAVK